MESQILLTLLNLRIARVLNEMKNWNADALIVFSQSNYRYLTNFTGEEAELVLSAKGDRTLLSDSRFDNQIKSQAPGELSVVMKQQDSISELTKVIQKNNVKCVLVEGEYISASQFKQLKDMNPNVKFVLVSQLVEKARNIKDQLELATMKKAIEISMASFQKILPEIHVGAIERQVGAKLDYLFKLNGGDGPSFETIVASGVRSAWAHGVASDKEIEAGDLVVVDFGTSYHGYASDITRTVAVGQVDPELEKIYQIVHDAQQRGIDAAKAGNTGDDVDHAARDYIKSQGYGQYFGHGIGHGVGLEVHELVSPQMPFRKETLKNSMVITVEPGIYLPNKGGVRIEDDVLISDDHPRVLSTLPKDELIHL